MWAQLLKVTSMAPLSLGLNRNASPRHVLRAEKRSLKSWSPVSTSEGQSKAKLGEVPQRMVLAGNGIGVGEQQEADQEPRPPWNS